MKKHTIYSLIAIIILGLSSAQTSAQSWMDSTSDMLLWPVRQASFATWGPPSDPSPELGLAQQDLMRLPQVDDLDEVAQGVEEFVEMKKIWSWSVEMGLNGSESQKDMFNMHLGIKVKRKTRCSTATFDMTHMNSSSDGERTARNLLYDTRLEWPCADRAWTYYIHHTGEYDEFKPFDIRLNFDSGIGYRFYDDGESHVIGRFGGSASREIGGTDNVTIPELVFGADVIEKINCMHTIEAKIEYYPDVQNWNDWRMNTSASWAILIDQTRNINLKFSIIERFDSHDPIDNQLTLDYAVLLMWTH